MQRVGEGMLKKISERIHSGENADDAKMRPLKPTTKGNYVPYAEQKSKKGLQPFRDWTFTGRTLAALKVTEATNESVTLAFINPVADRVAHKLNTMEPAFAVSPTDREELVKLFQEALKTDPLFKTEIE
jgi:hypothetical protein